MNKTEKIQPYSLKGWGLFQNGELIAIVPIQHINDNVKPPVIADKASQNGLRWAPLYELNA